MTPPPDSPQTATTAHGDSKPDPFEIAGNTKYAESDWYEQVYQGDKQAQLTWRAVLMGGVLGMLMSMANLYTTLKVGWSFGVSVTACVLSYVIWNALRLLSGRRLGEMSLLENNCMQSTASAAGYSTGSTIATAFGALLLIEGKHQGWVAVAAFTLFTALVGVFLAIPMKRQMVNQEKLPFPTGMAAATTLRSLYGRGAEALRKAYVLVGCLGAGLLMGFLKAPEGAVGFIDRILNRIQMRIPDLLPAAGYWQNGGRQLIGFGFEPSVLLIGAGMLIGVRVTFSMLAGSLLLYTVVGPWIISLDAAHAGEAGYRAAIPLVGGGTIFHLTRWALWGGTSLMVFASLASLAVEWRTVARAFSVLGAGRDGGKASATEQRMASIEIPLRWLVAGLVPASIGLIIVQVLAFKISIWLGMVAVAMSFVLSLVACRSTGETDTTPIGAMGKIMQLLFAVLSPGNVPHNLMAAGAGANAAASSADLLTDLKSGYMLGANPRKQFLAQFIGVFFGTLAVVPAWFLMVPNKAVLEAFNPPATNMWRAVAELLAGGGVSMLPRSAVAAIAVGALVGVLLPVLGKLRPTWSSYLPSAMGLGLSWVIVFSNCQAFAIGALIVWVWTRLHQKSADAYAIPAASGLIAGESIAAAGIAILATLLGFMG
jgi:OPT family oligopeptide transporter